MSERRLTELDRGHLRSAISRAIGKVPPGTYAASQTTTDALMAELEPLVASLLEDELKREREGRPSIREREEEIFGKRSDS